MSKVNALYHIVINTKHRKPTITLSAKRKLYAYMFGILRNKNCGVIRINGIENHIHLLIQLPPTLALSDVVGELKRSSNLWIKRQTEFPYFEGWGKEYFAVSISSQLKETVTNYIINQEVHHGKITFEDEMVEWFGSEGLEWNDYLLS